MKNDNFLLSLSISILIHLVVIYFFFFGLPYTRKYFQEEQIITFEMLSIDDVTNVPTQNKISEKPEDIKQEEAKKILNTTQSIETPAPELEKPKEEEKKLEEKIKDKKSEVENIITKNVKKELQKKEVEKPKDLEQKKIEKPKEVVRPKKKTDEDELESLLKTLEKTSKGSNNKSDKILTSQGDAKTTSKGPSSTTEKLSITEIALIRNKLNKAWNLPPGIKGGENVVVTLYIAFEKDGNITEVKIKNIICPIDQNSCNIMADSARRAVWSASPIDGLRKERYDLWKEMNVDFDPKKILGR